MKTTKIDQETYGEIRTEWFRQPSEVRAAVAPSRFVEIEIAKRAFEDELRQPRREALLVMIRAFDESCSAAGIEVVDEDDGDNHPEGT